VSGEAGAAIAVGSATTVAAKAAVLSVVNVFFNLLGFCISDAAIRGRK
jgi:hypothetical protein